MLVQRSCLSAIQSKSLEETSVTVSLDCASAVVHHQEDKTHSGCYSHTHNVHLIVRGTTKISEFCVVRLMVGVRLQSFFLVLT